jgi:hypothetical protein
MEKISTLFVKKINKNREKNQVRHTPAASQPPPLKRGIAESIALCSSFRKIPSPEGGLLHRRYGGGGVCQNENYLP